MCNCGIDMSMEEQAKRNSLVEDDDDSIGSSISGVSVCVMNVLGI